MALIEGGKLLGLRPVPVPVAGTGSMYPSLFWSTNEGGPEDESKKIIEEYRSTPHLYRRFNGFSLAGEQYLKRSVGYGDMVAFKNAKTSSILSTEGKDPNSGFIKRVIGVPGDTIELRDGFVYRNGELISEPYISSPRSTYGGSGVQDCKQVTVAPSTYFVLGDNRKVSSDSRFELGMVEDGDIEFVLPFQEQGVYQPMWRDTSRDSELLGQPSLEAEQFVQLVNAKRKSVGVGNLTLKQALSKSSSLRGEKLLQNKDTSYGMKQAVSAAGYTNILLGEFVSYGHFSSQELLENLLYNSNTAKQILNGDYDDIGVSAVNQEVDGCPTQVIVGHLGGYIPADYDQNTIDSWRTLKDNLQSVIPTWEQAVGNNRVDQDKLSQLITILRRRLELATEIVSTMENKTWLSPSQESRIQADSEDADAAQKLAKELNRE
jgi:signal peptidase I